MSNEYTKDTLPGIDPFVSPTFTLQNRLRRGLWAVVYILAFRYTPKPMRAWRVFLLRRFGAQIGKGCVVHATVSIWAPWNLVMDDESCLAERVICYSMATIRLGKRAVVSQGAHLCSGTHDYNDPLFHLFAKPITIGAKAWVCADAFVGPGVKIGEGAVLGARAVAMRHIPEWTVWSGNPAVKVKERKPQPI